MGILTSGLHQASGEVLPRYSEALRGLPLGMNHEPGKDHTAPWYRFGRKRQQLVAFIITGEEKLVSYKILEEMKRGVTSLHGTGMYTGQERAVLLCALTATEVNHLKSLVNQADANAFVIVTPAQEVLGKGFLPLEEK